MKKFNLKLKISYYLILHLKGGEKEMNKKSGRRLKKKKGLVSQTFSVICEPVHIGIKVRVYQYPNSNRISTKVKCPYLSGGHSDTCIRGGKGLSIPCSYSYELPHNCEE